MIRVAIAGGSGYTGGELLRLLARHPKVEVAAITSEKSTGRAVEEVFPFLRGFYNLRFEPLGATLGEKADFIFSALPHGAAAPLAGRWISAGARVIDLSADFRLRDPSAYQKYYRFAHPDHTLLAQAVYGLTEANRERIRNAPLVANPGCYPTGALLLLLPLLKEGLIDPSFQIIIDAKSGASGAGRAPSPRSLFAEANEGFGPYSVEGHRHLPEIEQEIGGRLPVLFTPYLLPATRGILTTIYLRVAAEKGSSAIQKSFEQAYAAEPFVRLSPEPPNISAVRGSNFCDIFFNLTGRTARLFSALDNLVKGASGQAVQNFNLMAGFDERTALEGIPIFP